MKDKVCCGTYCSDIELTRNPAREYAITSNVGTPSQDVNMDLPETQEEDLGWKTPDEKGRRKRSNTMLRKDPEDAEIQDQLATEERREATAVSCLS